MKLDKIKNNIDAQKSPYYTRGIYFFTRHPLALDLLINNFDLPLKQLCNILVEHGVTNGGLPYSISTISVLKLFIKDLGLVRTV
jgi:hypothetical protein